MDFDENFEIKKQYICSEVLHLTQSDKIKILSIVMRYDKNLVKSFKDGSRINLEKLPENIIVNIYDYIHYKVEQDEL